MSSLSHLFWGTSTSGEIVACGYNEYGQLGNGTNNDVLTMGKWDAVIPNGERTVLVVSGYQHSLAITANGNMYGFGNNEKGQLTGLQAKINTPQPIPPLPGKRWVAAACGCNHSLAITADGQLFGWGSNEFGQLGMGATFVESFTTPQLIAGGGLGQHKIVKIVCGYDNSFAWTENGTIYGFGKNNVGQLAMRNLTKHILPTPLNAGFNVKELVPADNVTWLLSDTDDVYYIGHVSATLGESDVPVKLHSFGSQEVVGFAAGSLHCIVLTGAGTLWGWGQNGYKQVGLTAPPNVSTFTQINLPGNPRITAISCGYQHTLALTAAGKIIGWGASSHGQLGSKATIIFPPTELPTGQFNLSSLYFSSYTPIFGYHAAPVEEAVELALPMPGRLAGGAGAVEQDKDAIIRSLRAKVAQQEQEIMSLKTEVMRLTVRREERSTDNTGFMNISFSQ